MRTDRVRPDADGPRSELRPLPRPGDDDDVRQPGLDRAADARRLPLRLPLRARPAGGGRGRHGRRLRPGLRPHHGRQPAHRARRRQRDGGDLQRPGQPLAAAGHRRPAGAGADHPAGQPDQPRRDPHAAPAGQVVLRAAARRGRAARPRPRRPPRRACRRRGPVFVSMPMDDWYAEVDEADAARGDRAHGRAAAPSPTPRRSARSPSASTPPPTRSSSPAPTSTPAAAGTRRSPSPSASACRSGRRPATGGGRLGFPEGHPNFRGVLPPAIGPVGQTLEGHDLILVVGSSVFPYYPYIPGPLLPEGAKLVAITSDPDEAARAPMGDAIVADVKLTLEALLEAVPGVRRARRPSRTRARRKSPPSRPAQLLDRPHRPGRGLPRGRRSSCSSRPPAPSRCATSCASRAPAATTSAPAAASASASPPRSACSSPSPTARSSA